MQSLVVSDKLREQTIEIAVRVPDSATPTVCIVNLRLRHETCILMQPVPVNRKRDTETLKQYLDRRRVRQENLFSTSYGRMYL
jgi:hypothetical protein